MDAKKVVEYALSQIGTAEDPLGSNRQKYGALIDSTDWYLYKDGDKTWRHKVNGYDWCTQFVDASFITTFLGIDKARKMLFRPVYNNMGAVVKYAFNYFKAAGRGYTKEEYDPKPGDVIYFQNSKGLSHTGIVVDVNDTTVTTVEGNSGKNNWYVAKHNYRKVDDYIYGYGHPDYDEPGPEPTPKKNGWEKEDGKWYFYKDGEKIASDWVKWKGSWYYMGDDGAMMTGWQVVNGKKYYLYPNGVMAQDEWVEGSFADMSGYVTDRNGKWHDEERGKWFGDGSGWYPKSRSVRIDGADYRFDKNGYVI